MDLLDRMLGHDPWTTEHLLEMSKDLSDEQLDQDFDIGHRTLRKTFDHMILALEFWTGFMDGKPVDWAPRAASIDEMIERHAKAYAHFTSVARDRVATNRLDELFIDHYDYPQSYGATIIHVIYHNVQHRSDVLHILQRLGKAELPEADPQEWEHMTGIIKAAGA